MPSERQLALLKVLQDTAMYLRNDANRGYQGDSVCIQVILDTEAEQAEQMAAEYEAAIYAPNKRMGYGRY